MILSVDAAKFGSGTKEISEKKVSELISEGLLEFIEEQPQPMCLMGTAQRLWLRVKAPDRCRSHFGILFGVCNKV